MTKPQKERIMLSILENKEDRNMFQLKLMIEHEINGFNADKDEPCSLDHTLFDLDYFEDEKRKLL